MMTGLAIGGAYGISAGLIIYAIETGLIPEEWHGRLIVLWAIAGLILAVVGVMRRKSES